MMRLFDWSCSSCGTRAEQLVRVPAGQDLVKRRALPCDPCGGYELHAVALSLPAPYMGERVINPMVRGGSFDTMGYRQQPALPDLPGEREHSERLSKALASAPVSERRSVASEMSKTAPTMADYSALFSSPGYKEVVAERKRIRAENAEKRKRLAAIKRGENINMRRDRCAGDPMVTA